VVKVGKLAEIPEGNHIDVRNEGRYKGGPA